MLGSLLPQTDDAEADLAIFEKLMAFDDEGLARRALVQNVLKPKDIAARIELDDPWRYFAWTAKASRCADAYRTYDDNQQDAERRPDKRSASGNASGAIETWRFPLECDELGIKLRWRRDR